MALSGFTGLDLLMRSSVAPGRVTGDVSIAVAMMSVRLGSYCKLLLKEQDCENVEQCGVYKHSEGQLADPAASALTAFRSI